MRLQGVRVRRYVQFDGRFQRGLHVVSLSTRVEIDYLNLEHRAQLDDAVGEISTPSRTTFESVAASLAALAPPDNSTNRCPSCVFEIFLTSTPSFPGSTAFWTAFNASSKVSPPATFIRTAGGLRDFGHSARGVGAGCVLPCLFLLTTVNSASSPSSDELDDARLPAADTYVRTGFAGVGAGEVDLAGATILPRGRSRSANGVSATSSAEAAH